MRSRILYILKNAADYVSGEEIAKKLQVSRTAVWKHIRELRAAGYTIESHPRNGYKLVEAPDLLLPGEVKSRLRTRWLGRELRYYKSVDSTNRIAKLFDEENLPEGSVAVSEEQTGGKGRLSRGWLSPLYKGIWFSVLLRPKFLPQEAPKCTLMAAVAIVRAIENVAGIQCGIKWPNDILCGGRKLVGILTEMNAEMERIHYVVIGMGVNVNLDKEDYPEELQDVGISLKMVKGEKIDRLALFVEILGQLEAFYDDVCQNGFSRVFAEWRRYSVTLGQEVNVIGADRTFSGKAIDIDADGALLVETDGQIVKVLAGDVSIRPKK